MNNEQIIKMLINRYNNAVHCGNVYASRGLSLTGDDRQRNFNHYLYFRGVVHTLDSILTEMDYRNHLQSGRDLIEWLNV